MYKTDQRGATRYWQIGFEPTTNELISRYGVLQKSDGTPGAIRTGRLTVKLNKAGRDYQAQALLQARSKFKSKYKKNYRRQNEETPTRPLPQLSNPYIPPDINVRSNVTDDNLLRGVVCQPKVDGIRALAWKDEKSVTLLSRLNNEFSSPVHIREELWYYFFYLDNSIKRYLPNYRREFGIDGELYNHDIIFEKISSIVRSESTIPEAIYDMKYYIFDIIILDVPVETRIAIMTESYNLFIESQYYKGNILVLTSTVAHSHQEIKRLHDHYVSLGYEGLMIRKMSGPNPSNLKESYYKPERNNNLLKYKEFQDDEGTIIDIVSGEGKEEELAIMVIRDKNGKVFNVRPRGSYESRKLIYDNKNKYIGVQYTYRFFELTEYGIPRFPVGIAFRTYE